WTDQDKCQNASNIEQIAFISGRSELCSPVLETYQLDRSEAIWQMNRKDRNRKQNGGRNTHERNEGPNQESDARDDLGGDCDPSHKVRQRNTHRTKNACEHFWAFGPFRKAVRQKSITKDQSERDCCVWGRLYPHIPPIQHIRYQRRHCLFLHRDV